MPRKRSAAPVDPLEPLAIGEGSVPDGDGTVALSVSPSGAPALLPASLRNLPPALTEDVAKLQQLGLEIAQLRAQVDHLVYELRDAGVAWSGIGFCLGLSHEGARQRWGAEG